MLRLVVLRCLQLELKVDQQEAMQQHVAEVDNRYRQMVLHMHVMYNHTMAALGAKRKLEQELARLKRATGHVSVAGAIIL